MAENGNGSNGNGNGYTPVWMRLFLQVGFPTAVAILLLGSLMGWLPSPVMQTLQRIEYNGWVQNSLLRSICYSQANSGCEPWKEQGK